MTKKLHLLIVLLWFAQASAQRQYRVHTVAFYNVENLFDTINDGGRGDDEFLPKGDQAWTGARYKHKLSNIARVLAETGTGDNPGPPSIIGLAELENRRVLEDLSRQPELLDKDYGIIHFDSPDSRGTDVGLLYRKEYFRPVSASHIPLILRDSLAAKGKRGRRKAPPRLFTRDQLLVTGLLEGEEIHIIVNHWPSRYGGEKRSSPQRKAAAALNKNIIDSLQRKDPAARIITMGDFNDSPYDDSLKKVLAAEGRKDRVASGGLYNPMAGLAARGLGTVAYRDAWAVFDQLIVSQPLLEGSPRHFRFWKAGIFNPAYLSTPSGQYKGYPLRTSYGAEGYSDHFPVYLYLIREEGN